MMAVLRNGTEGREDRTGHGHGGKRARGQDGARTGREESARAGRGTDREGADGAAHVVDGAPVQECHPSFPLVVFKYCLATVKYPA